MDLTPILQCRLPLSLKESCVMSRRLTVLAGGLVLLCAVPLAAQDPVLSEMYGSGVHAYFSQDFNQAYQDFTGAVDAGTTDPRCYYFRGLTFLQLGREDEARMDFEQAAQLEAHDVNQFYNVGRALERIQGSTRLMVEQYRALARVEAMKEAEKLRQERYGKLREAEGRVLEAQAKAAPAEVPAPPPPSTVTGPFGLEATPSTSIGPDTVPAQPAKEPAAAQPAAAPAAPAQEDPFLVAPVAPAARAGMAPPPAAQPAPAQPAAAEPAPAQPAAEPAAAVPPDASASNIFGALGKAVGKAVGAEAIKEAIPGAPVSDNPFGAPAPAPAQPAAPAGNPFGAMPPAGAEPGAPAGAQPAAPADNPFGAPAPAPAQPAAPGGDPFGAMAPAGAQPAAKANPFQEEETKEESVAPPAPDDPFAQGPAKK
jgi:hypothetical protein